MKYKIIFFTSMIVAQFIYWLRTFFWLLDGNTSRDMILLCVLPFRRVCLHVVFHSHEKSYH